RGKELQQSLAQTDPSARVSAHIDNQTLLREIHIGNHASHFVDKSIDHFLINFKTEQPDVSEFATADLPHFGIKIILKGLANDDGVLLSKEHFLELVDFLFLDIDGGPFLSF